MANVPAIQSAYLEAQRIVDRKLEYSNPYAMPIAVKAINDASARLGASASTIDVVHAAFHGRLRGTVVKVLRQRKIPLGEVSAND